MSMPAAAALPPQPLLLLRQLVACRWLWCLAVVAVPLLRMAIGGKSDLGVTLGDTDDATRIIQVEALLNGAGWFDTSLAKIGGATPLVSHWSRLIDAPLAILIAAFGLFTSHDNALLLTRIIWPSLLLLVFCRILVAETEARAGTRAAVICLVLAVTCLTGLFQFRVGRIDHHNAMITGSIGGLLMLARSLEQPRLAAIAGVMLGLTLAIGYEPLALIVPLLGLASLAAAVDTRFAPALAATLKAMAATLLAALLMTTAPSRWTVAACDALSINMVLLVLVGAVGLHIIAQRREAWSPGRRIGALAATGAVAVAAFLTPDTACLAGPFGQVSAEAKQIWLVTVRETQSILVEAKGSPLIAVSFLLLAATGLWAAVSRWRSARTIEAAATAIVVICSIPPALFQLKFLPYASWLAIVAIALRVANFEGRGDMTPRAARLAGVVGLNQWTMATISGIVLVAAGMPLGDADDGSESCYETKNVRPLASLPAGLVASSANMGPYIAALTPHSVLAAPYHRIDTQIVQSFRIFESPLADSNRLLAQSGARYLVHCAKETRAAKAKPGSDTLASALLTKDTPSFLREIPGVSPMPELRVFEIIRLAR